jgi:hypothetical protein
MRQASSVAALVLSVAFDHVASARTPLVTAAVGTSAHATRVAHVAKKADRARAVLPGFETLSDGSTRLFVELSHPATYETKTEDNRLIYVLKDTVVERRNNCNPLVTVDFNTAVASARLVPHGKDVWFLVTLRVKAEPVVTMDAAEGTAAVFHVAFAKGDYLPAASKGAASPAAEGEDDDAEPAPTSASPDDATSAASVSDDAPSTKHSHHHHD